MRQTTHSSLLYPRSPNTRNGITIVSYHVLLFPAACGTTWIAAANCSGRTGLRDSAYRHDRFDLLGSTTSIHSASRVTPREAHFSSSSPPDLRCFLLTRSSLKVINATEQTVAVAQWPCGHQLIAPLAAFPTFHFILYSAVALSKHFSRPVFGMVEQSSGSWLGR
jgi:hypothetical protein